MRLTIRLLNQRYLDYEIFKDKKMLSKYPYGIRHRLSGKKTVCLISTLKGVEHLIKMEELNNTSFWR